MARVKALTLRATLRLLCRGSDFVDLVVFERRDVLDDKGQGGVDSFSDSVGLTTLLRSADQRHDGALLPSASVPHASDPTVRRCWSRGEGSRRVSAIVLIEIFTAQRLDTWRRLKICRNEVVQRVVL